MRELLRETTDLGSKLKDVKSRIAALERVRGGLADPDLTGRDAVQHDGVR